MMYICICKAVTEGQIREATTTGVRSLKALRRELGVSGGCGQCATAAKQCLKDTLKAAANMVKAAKPKKKKRPHSGKKV